MKDVGSILILEDNDERIAAFERAITSLPGQYELKIWRDAQSMTSDCEACFANAALISLDHDLNPAPGVTEDPGTGLDVAKFLAECRPVCPVIIHSTNTDRSWSMHNELRFADWIVDKVGPIGSDWIEKLWLPKAQELLTQHQNTWVGGLPSDHAVRMERALLSLNGLSVGDGFGECFFTTPDMIKRRIKQREPPPPPWFVTDDTMMARSIVRCLKRYARIDQDALAVAFAREYAGDPTRGYGGGARIILQLIAGGIPWKTAARQAFNGQGSCGNGGAMRVAPIGAYFADDVQKVIAEAAASAEVTHAHADGQTGAIAVALAVAYMVRGGERVRKPDLALVEFVLNQIPQTDTYYRLKRALEIPLSLSPVTAASRLGNGMRVIASDTVPFCLWCAARHPDHYVEALWSTVSVGGDIDTNCAIVGGIVALSAGRDSIPLDWLKARESFNV
jgi:ADP-ribosylglycohydrolase